MRRMAIPTLLVCLVLSGPVAAAGQREAPRERLRLTYRLPDGWTSDYRAADRLGLYNVFLPEGTSMRNAPAVITVERQPKDPRTPTLKAYAMSVMTDIVRMFPDLEGKRWRPENPALDADHVAGIEMLGLDHDVPPPQRILLLDAGDGYFGIVLTVKERRILDEPALKDFFSSIRLE